MGYELLTTDEQGSILREHLYVAERDVFIHGLHREEAQGVLDTIPPGAEHDLERDGVKAHLAEFDVLVAVAARKTETVKARLDALGEPYAPPPPPTPSPLEPPAPAIPPDGHTGLDVPPSPPENEPPAPAG